ncbi:putative molybdenum cofactor guanylyltransferase [Ruminiclostridium hungatei]|uniref:Probable molybdenum cofactor guanylyltransferase n=1 Tax=Ruminiclostridium hungatei TaxID=48256 RepID=A0A1V4SJ47_RUMHU|nr:molybdenum cofactor guanylyltransferase [Ruminiclostridium hungatei]OPX43908.1 putative molybdenum cofactor guanylyltransferase [Ruminiclostridium hungatei]
MTGIILAGGKNSRMGRKKAFINVEGNTIINRILAIFKEVFSEVIIVSNTPEDFSYTGVKVVTDIIPDKGSLGGLYTGLVNMKYERCFVVACDMPYISKSLVKYIIDIPRYDIVVPKIEGLYEPLFACYSRKCANLAKRQVEEGNLRITDIYSYFTVKEIHEDEIRKFDSNMRSLVNINTPEDLTSSLFGSGV